MTWTLSVLQGILHLSVLISCLSVVLNCESVLSSTDKDWSPNIELIEILPGKDNKTAEIKRLHKPKNTDIIVGEDVNKNSRLLIKCNATFPVQFIYIGAGRPEFTTYTNVQWRADPEAPLTFEAEVSLGLLGFQGTLREEDTGNYTCRSIQNSTIFSYYYIYVPGPSIFTPPDGYNSELYFTPKDKNMWIPCTAANPKAIVSLHKTSNGRLGCPSNEGGGISSYNPRKGFQVNLKEVKSPQGVYVCVASYDNSFRMMEYQLIPTNASLPDGKRHPCAPSPCAKSAECSVVDGFPVCYCFRGTSGNPYSECLINKDRCNANEDCGKGLLCVQGQCSKDPCEPVSPCGQGSTCLSYGGRARCSCKTGYDGKPPYCRKKCETNSECTETEGCVRGTCDNVCPGPCGIGAECLVVQTNYNRTAVCSCGPGYFGDALDRCYAIGDDVNTTPPPWASCPQGYVGPGPPNCKKAECQTDSDCSPYRPFKKVCKGRLCVDPEGQCPNTCGTDAICQLSRISGQPTCTCPVGTTGDPLIKCFNSTTTTDEEESGLCDPNPCPGNSVCEIGSTRGVICVCPEGSRGQPPNCITSPPDFQRCSNSRRDCPQGEECIDGICFDPCDGSCGLNSKCGFNSGRFVCNCLENYAGDPYTACWPLGSSPGGIFPAGPSSSGGSSSFPSSSSGSSSGRPSSPANSFPGSASRPPSTPGNSSGRPSPPGSSFPGSSGPPSSSRPSSPSSSFPSSGRPSSSVGSFPAPGSPSFGRPSSPGRFPSSPEGPSTQGVLPSPASSPCDSSPCANFAECRVISDQAACRCILGYEGDAYEICYPSHTPNNNNENNNNNNLPISPEENFVSTDTPRWRTFLTTTTSRPLNKEDECDARQPRSCGTNFVCHTDFDGIARCLCISEQCKPHKLPRPLKPIGSRISGGGRRLCRNYKDCFSPDLCINSTCVNPCGQEHSPCANVGNSECRVIEGRHLCTCRRGYVGSPANGIDCRPDRMQSPLVSCDIRRGTGCDTKSECRIVDDRARCVCGPGYVGNYPDCRLQCGADTDCHDAHACVDYQCVNPCEKRNICGNHAFCRVIDHNPRCECQPGFSGNPWIGCNERERIRARRVSSSVTNTNCYPGTRCTLF